MATSKDYLLSNKFYDRLKTFSLVILPALGTLYYGLAQIWGLPDAEQVVGSIVVITAFLGVIIKIGDRSYNASEDKFDGTLNIVPKASGKELYDMQLSKPAEDLKAQDAVTFKVVDGT
ncbi:MAG TPA: phage holin [Nitrospira sp.]|nr:phage holin [Nitrospira sp.]